MSLPQAWREGQPSEGLLQHTPAAQLIAALQTPPANILQAQRRSLESLNVLQTVEECKFREEQMTDLEKKVRLSLIPHLYGSVEPDTISGIRLFPYPKAEVESELDAPSASVPPSALSMHKNDTSESGGSGVKRRTPISMFDTVQNLMLSTNSPLFVVGSDSNLTERCLRDPIPGCTPLHRDATSLMALLAERLVKEVIEDMRRIQMLEGRDLDLRLAKEAVARLMGRR